MDTDDKLRRALIKDDIKHRIKGRTGPSPTILRKGGPMKDKTKYTRKEKHSVRDT